MSRPSHEEIERCKRAAEQLVADFPPQGSFAAPTGSAALWDVHRYRRRNHIPATAWRVMQGDAVIMDGLAYEAAMVLAAAHNSSVPPNSEIRHGGPETPELKPKRNPPLPASNG